MICAIDLQTYEQAKQDLENSQTVSYFSYSFFPCEALRLCTAFWGYEKP